MKVIEEETAGRDGPSKGSTAQQFHLLGLKGAGQRLPFLRFASLVICLFYSMSLEPFFSAWYRSENGEREAR